MGGEVAVSGVLAGLIGSREVMLVSEGEKKVSKVWRGEIQCAHCGKQNVVRIDKETLEPAVPAQTEIRVTVEKSVQTVLG